MEDAWQIQAVESRWKRLEAEKHKDNYIKMGTEGGRGRACLDVALFVSLRLASNLPCSNLSIETVKPKAWAISIPIEDAGYVGMIEGATLGAGRQVATP